MFVDTIATLIWNEAAELQRLHQILFKELFLNTPI